MPIPSSVRTHLQVAFENFLRDPKGHVIDLSEWMEIYIRHWENQDERGKS